MNFWEHMPEDLYNSWKADEFTSNAIQRLRQVTNQPSIPTLSSVGDNAFNTFKNAIKTSTAAVGGLSGDAASSIGRGFETFRNTRPANAAKSFIDRLNETEERVGGAGIYGVQRLNRIPGFDLSPVGMATSLYGKGRPGLPSDFRSTYQEAGPLQQFAAKSVADPLSYVGMFGNAARGLGATGKVVKAAELLDLKPLTGAIERLGVKGASALAGGFGRPDDAPNLLTRLGTGLTAASRRGTMQQAGQEMFDIARLLTEHADSEYGIGAAAKGKGAFLEGGAPQVGYVRRWLSTPVGKYVKEIDEKFGRQYGLDVLERASKSSSTPLEFAQKASEIVSQDYGELYNTSVAASRAGRSGLPKLATDITQGIGRGYERSIGPVNRALSNYVLGTAMFPVGNAGEAGIRSASGGVFPGRMSPEEASRILAGVPGVPREIFEGRGGSTARALANEPSTGGWKDWVTGKVFLNASGRMTAPIETNFLARQYQKTGDAAQALQAFSRAFPTATGTESNFARFAKSIMPFYGYESARWPYLAQQALQRPGLANVYRNFMDKSDSGNIPSGLPGFQIGPFRGSVFQGPQMLAKPQFPTYAQGKSGRIERALNLGGRFGFYPSPAINAAISLGRAVEGEPSETGSLIPSALQAPVNLAQGITRVQIPGTQKYTGDITDKIPVVGTLLNRLAEGATNFGNLFDDRYQEYYVNKELAIMGIEPEKATPAERLDAEKRVGARLFGMTESNMLRFRPTEEVKYREDLKNAAIAAGVPSDLAQSQTSNPISAKDAQGNFVLPAATRRQIYEQHPEFEKWRQVNEPLKRPEEQKINASTRDFHQELDTINQSTQDRLNSLYKGIQSGKISWKDARDLRSDIMSDAAAQRERATSRAKEKGALVDRPSQEAFYAKSGRDMPGQLPQDEAAQAYYDIQPKRDEVGRIDYESWNTQRKAFLATLPPDTRKYILEDYPKKKYEGDPLVQAGEKEYSRRAALMSQYLDLPQYRGISNEDAKGLTEAANLQAALRQMHPNWGPNRILTEVKAEFPEVKVELLRTRNSRRLPDRRKFLEANPDLVAFLSDAILPQ